MVAFTSTFAAATLLLASVASAAPTMEERQFSPSVKYCDKAGYKGKCVDTGVVPGQCNKVADGFDNRVSSLLMDAGLICTVYCEAGCEGGKSAVLETQNNPNFATMTNMDNCMTSFSCT